MTNNSFKLCEVADLSLDTPIECEGPDGNLIVVVLHADKIYAVAGECPHQEAPMADAEVEDGTITCCLHFWKWNLADGSPVEEAEEPLPTFAVEVKDGGVYLC